MSDPTTSEAPAPIKLRNPTVQEAWEAAVGQLGWDRPTFEAAMLSEYGVDTDGLDWATAEVPEPGALTQEPVPVGIESRPIDRSNPSGGTTPIVRQGPVDTKPSWSDLSFESEPGPFDGGPATVEEAQELARQESLAAMTDYLEKQQKRGIGRGPEAAQVRAQRGSTVNTSDWDPRMFPRLQKARPVEPDEEPIVGGGTGPAKLTAEPKGPRDLRRDRNLSEARRIIDARSAGLPGQGVITPTTQDLGREIINTPGRVAGGIYGLGAGSGDVLADWLEETFHRWGESDESKARRKPYEDANPTRLNKIRRELIDNVGSINEEDPGLGYAMAADTMHLVESITGLFIDVLGWHGHDTDADKVEGAWPHLKAQFFEASEATKELFPAMAVHIGQVAEELSEGKFDTVFAKPISTGLVFIPFLRLIENGLKGLPGGVGEAVGPYVDTAFHPYRAIKTKMEPGMRRVGQALQESPLGSVVHKPRLNLSDWSTESWVEALSSPSGTGLLHRFGEVLDRASSYLDKGLGFAGRQIKEAGRHKAPASTPKGRSTEMTDEQAFRELTEERFADTQKLIEEGVPASEFSGAGGDALRQATTRHNRAQRKLERRRERATEQGDVMNPDVPGATAARDAAAADLSTARQASRFADRAALKAESALARAEKALYDKRAEAAGRGRAPTAPEVQAMRAAVEAAKLELKEARAAQRTVKAELRRREARMEELEQRGVAEEGAPVIASEAAARTKDIGQELARDQAAYEQAVADGKIIPDSKAGREARNAMHAKRGKQRALAKDSKDPALIEAVQDLYDAEVARRANLLEEKYDNRNVAQRILEAVNEGRPVAGIAGELAGRGATPAQIAVLKTEIQRFLGDLRTSGRLKKQLEELRDGPVPVAAGTPSAEDLTAAAEAQSIASQKVVESGERVRALEEALAERRTEAREGGNAQRAAERDAKRIEELEAKQQEAAQRAADTTLTDIERVQAADQIASLEADLVVARENLAAQRKGERTAESINRLERELEQARIDREAAEALYEEPGRTQLTMSAAQSRARAQVIDEFVGDNLAERPAIYRPTVKDEAGLPKDTAGAQRALGQMGYVRINRDIAAWLGRHNLAGLWMRKGLNSRIKWRARAENMMRTDGFWQEFNRLAKRNVTTRNLSSAANNVLGMIYHHILQMGDLAGWSQRMVEVTGLPLVKEGLLRKFVESPETLAPDVRLMMEQIRDTGLNDTTLFKELSEMDGQPLLGSGRVSKPLVHNRAMEKVYNWGDQTGKLVRAIYVYRKLTEYFDKMEVGTTMKLPTSSNRMATLKKVGEKTDPTGAHPSGVFELNGKPITEAQLAQVRAKTGAQNANDILFDYKNVGRFEDWMKGSAILGVASPFVTWQMKALDLPFFKKGLMARLVDDIPYVWTDSAAVNAAIARTRAYRMVNVGKYVSQSVGGGDKYDDLERLMYTYSPKNVRPSLRRISDNPFIMNVFDLGSVDVLDPTRRLINLAWHYGMSPNVDELVKEMKHEGRYDPGLRWMKDGKGKVKPEWKDEHRRITAERELLIKTKGGQRGNMSDHLALVGLAGSFLMNTVAAMQRGGKPGQAEVSWQSLTNKVAPLALGGTSWRVIRTVLGDEALPGELDYDFSRRGWADAQLPQGEQDRLKYYIRGITGKYYNPQLERERGIKYFKDQERVLKSSMTRPLVIAAKGNETRRQHWAKVARGGPTAEIREEAAKTELVYRKRVASFRKQAENISKIIQTEMDEQKARFLERRKRRHENVRRTRPQQKERGSGTGARKAREGDPRRTGDRGVRGAGGGARGAGGGARGAGGGARGAGEGVRRVR